MALRGTRSRGFGWVAGLLAVQSVLPLGGGPGLAGDAVVPPSLIASGPYGDPFAMRPPGHAAIRFRGVEAPSQTGALPERPTGPGAVLRRGSSLPVKAGEGDDDEDDDDDAPRRPGTLGQDYVKVPAVVPPLRRSKPTLGPHLSPDREFEITERTSMGVFGQADRLEARVPGFGSARTMPTATPSIRARDVGAGLGFQVKIGP